MTVFLFALSMQRKVFDLGAIIAGLMLVFAGAACHSEQARTDSPVTEPCDLLSSSDISSVQGEPVSAATGDKKTNGSFVISECFYKLPTFNKSVSVDVMSAGGNSDAASEFWNKRFHNVDPDTDELEARTDAAPKNSNTGHAEADEDRLKSPPVPVPGLGDEAFWTGSQINGSLYIRHRSDIIRLSIGGSDDQSVKIEKAKILGARVLSKL